MSSKQEVYKNKWEERYGQADYAYGKEPNLFFEQILSQVPSGKLLLPAEGEGRNAVYAANQGWEVTAFDLSQNAKSKAMALAKSQGVTIDYHVGSLEELGFQEDTFDAIGLLYAHFLAEQREDYHRQLTTFLKPGGLLILEAFGKNHLPLVQANPKIGGPREADLLLSLEEIKASFEGFDMQLLEEVQVELSEGLYHNGLGSVVRFVGRKL